MHRIGAVLVLAFLSGCGADEARPADAGGTLYDRLGGAAGVRTVVDDLLARAYADDQINGYFRNASVDRSRLATCFARYLGAAAGGPEAYPGSGCGSVAEAHAGLGISGNDHADLVGHLDAALAAAGVAAADRAAVLDLLAGAEADVVEDPTSDATVYQRVGRKPAIGAVVTDFEARVAADPRVNGFFAGVTDLTRLHQCLTRQVCSIDGPCRYGEELPEEFAPLPSQPPCRGMIATHDGLRDTEGSPITIDDFNAIAENLVMALTAAGVAEADRTAIIGAIAPLCAEIVAGGTGCP